MRALPVILLMGPTASGKTRLAIELVQRLPLDIISVDSAMVYRGMDIGTAKPDAQELALAPHRLIDILDPAEAYSAARFVEDARREIARVHAEGRIPLLVGGTMLYFRALLRGLSRLPEADEDTRADLLAEANKHGWPALHARLQSIDPIAAARIHPNDAQRIQRALEVVELTGKGPSVWHDEADEAVFPWQVLKMAVYGGGRQNLRERIAMRFNAMIEKGFIDEVQTLYEREDLGPDCPSMRAVGYRQLWQFLAGEQTLEQAVEKGITATRQLAKRQMTWLRSETGLRIADEGGPADPKWVMDNLISDVIDL